MECLWCSLERWRFWYFEGKLFVRVKQKVETSKEGRISPTAERVELHAHTIQLYTYEHTYIRIFTHGLPTPTHPLAHIHTYAKPYTPTHIRSHASTHIFTYSYIHTYTHPADFFQTLHIKSFHKKMYLSQGYKRT